MKKLLIISMIAAATIGMIGCGDDGDETLADIQWLNDAGSQVETIQWVSAGSTDQTWGGTYLDGDSTAPKGITKLTGQGECVDSNGDPATINLDVTSTGTTVADGATNATIEENVTANLVIEGTTAK